MAGESYPHYIEFRNVYKSFDHPVLKDVSFHLDSWPDAGHYRAKRCWKIGDVDAHHGLYEARSRAR